jgi:hypothetical protein
MGRIIVIMWVGLLVWLVMAANNEVMLKEIEYDRVCMEIDARNTKADFLLSFGK